MEEFQKWITKSKNTKKGHELAFCQLCHCDITAHKTDLVRHSKSEKHILNERQVASNEKVKNITFFSEDDSVKRAEIKLAAFLASNNLPFIMMDTLSPLCSNLFPDSKIASKLAIRRTKSTMVVRHCLGEVFQKNLIDILRVPGTFFP
ncbi:hat family dimerization domaincontaining protein-related [Holotrichia oblita]|nr:hat family dimerization domaincontaining protein-related [Holotrichia oblita]